MKADPQDTWTVLAILKWTTNHFKDKGVSEPRTSAEVLLAHVLNLGRLDLYLRYDQPLTAEELARFKALVMRRRQGEPVAYLTGRREFWSLDFRVSPAVLIPRPETEVLVEAALTAARESGQGSAGQNLPLPSPAPPSPLLGLELGVGSGAVVVALARELPASCWLALDLSAAALGLARDNARRHGVETRVQFLQADLLTALKPRAGFALLVANLPYVPRGEWERQPREIKDYEPREALLAGEDGLALLGPLSRQAHRYLRPGGWLLLEVGAGQAGQVLEWLQETGAYDQVETVKDYQEIQRVVRGRRRLDLD